jgi:hypothetical protein
MEGPMMRTTRRLVATGVAVLAIGGASVAPAMAAYPQTRPKAGQFCRIKDIGVVTRASNGRLVRCYSRGSEPRNHPHWHYT